MSETNPSITANDIILEVEARLGSPNIAQASYIPWISYAYQKEYGKIVRIGQHVKERVFGELVTFDLTASTAEYALSSVIPQFGGFIRGQIKYGGTSDDWVKLKVLKSLSSWDDMTNVTTSDWPKQDALIYFIKDYVGFIPTPPAASVDTGTPQAKIWYIKRPVRITVATDVIDIPYRFTFPIVSYVQAMGIMAENEDYTQAARVEARFEADLEEVAQTIESEFSEREEANVIEATDTALYDDPLRY